MSRPIETEDVWLGIDGGGSKTDFQLVSSDGRIRGEATLGGINPNYCTESEVVSLLEAGKRKVFSAAGLEESIFVSGTIICLAGFSPELDERFGGLPGFGEIFFSGDHLPLLELCGGHESCVIIHSGTGSFVSSRLADSAIRYWGGYGYLLHDPGSGSDLGRRAVRRAFEEYTGIAPRSEFGERIQGFYGFRNFEHLVEVVYGSPSAASTLAECVRVVVELLEEGNLQAREIVEASLGELASLARKVAEEFPEEPYGRVLTGGVLAVPRMAQFMRQELRARGVSGHWTSLADRPIEGVRRMLVKWAKGMHPDLKCRAVLT